MKASILAIFLLFVLFLLHSQEGGRRGTIVVAKQKLSRIEEFDLGQKVFKESYCTYCHTPYKYDSEVRKGIILLKGVSSRRSKQWLYFFLRSPHMLTEAGDTAVIRINNDIVTKYREKQTWLWVIGQHPAYEELNYRKINALFFYVDSLNRRKERFEYEKKRY